ADVDWLQHVFLRSVAPPLVAVGGAAIGVAVAAMLLPEAAVVLGVGLLFAATIVPLAGRLAARGAGRRQAPVRAELTSELVELIEGAPELVVYGRAETQGERVLAADRHLARLVRRGAVASGLSAGLGAVRASGTAAVVVAVSVPAVRDGRLDGVYLAVLAFVGLASFEAVTPLPAALEQLVVSRSVSRRLR